MAGALNLKYPHAFSGLIAILLTLGILALGTLYAQSLEQQYVHLLAPLMLPQSINGIALQQAGLQQPDLLMVYGASEMLVEDVPTKIKYGQSIISVPGTSYGASQFFKDEPSGFGVYEIAAFGAPSLSVAQDLAAIGPELRGKKVVISLTPSIFLFEKRALLSDYLVDYSSLHANALIFDPYLSLTTKTIAAHSMNNYPSILTEDPILQFAVQQLNCKCRTGRYGYYLIWPLGQLRIWIIRLQDHWEALNLIRNYPKVNTPMVRKPTPIDWSAEISQAQSLQKTYSNNNPYGIENEVWSAYYSTRLADPKKPGSADYGFTHNLNTSGEWIDLDLMLRVLKEMGAQPLIVSRPLSGPIWDTMGVSEHARSRYYSKLHNVVSIYGFPVVDFADHDSDVYFCTDAYSHASRMGWVYVDLTLDEFFHGKIH